MSRKRKHKKSKSGSEGQWTRTGAQTTGEVSSSETQELESAPVAEPAAAEARNEKNNLAGPAKEGIRLEANPEAAGAAKPPDAVPGSKVSPSGQQAKPQFQEPEQIEEVSKKLSDTEQGPMEESEREPLYGEKPPSQGRLRKFLRWLWGPLPASVRLPSNPPGAIEGESIPTPSPAGGVPPSGRVPSGKISGVSGVSGGGPSSAVSRVHAVLMLERVLPELEETKRKLQSERETAQAKIRDLENDRDRYRAEAERARNERADIEGHTNVIRKSVNALERQLQEEKVMAARKVEEYEARIRSFEESLKNFRSPVTELRTDLEESQSQREQLESLLDRAKAELETTQRQLQEEREVSRGRIEQLESELSRKSGASEQAISERARIEERAALVQKALEVMEHQLREERESFAKRIQQLETELNQTRAKSTQLETRVSTLIGELEKGKSHSRKKVPAQETESQGGTTLTTGSAGRIQALERELDTGLSSVSTDKQTTRISRLESRWEDLKSRLLPKDKEIAELRLQAEEFRAQIEALEAALAEAKQPSGSSSGVAEAEVPGGGFLSPSRDAMEMLYRESMGKLTVLMASADIVLMNPKLDPKTKGSLQDIKTEGQALLELIRSYTLSPEAKKSE